jgi:threonine dehydratase
MTNPVQVSIDAIRGAKNRIASIVHPSPVLRSLYLTERFRRNIVLKLENLNISGSFKIRGATNALSMLSSEELSKGVVAASAGNHAQAVAYVCREMKIRSTIFMPESTPMIKAESTRLLGADIHLVGETLDDSYKSAEEFRKKSGAYMVHPFADVNVIAGQGTIGLELLEQIQDLSTVVVPIGGGGMISGIATAIKHLKPEVKIVGVQSTAFPSMKLSYDAGKIVDVKRGKTIADGIAVKSVRELNFNIIRNLVDEILLVDDDEIAAAVMDLIERNHLLAEGAGAASVAAIDKLLSSHLSLGSGSIACVIGGGNIDIALMRRITLKGLVKSGRVMRFRAKISDRPGGLASLLRIIADSKANLIDVYHDRAFGTSHFHDVEVDVSVETSNWDHQAHLRNALADAKIDFLILQ